MQIRRYRMREGKLPLVTIFMAGLFAGMFIMNFGKSILLEDTGFLDEYTLYHMKYMTVDSGALFYYILRHRLGRLIVLAVLSTTYLGFAVCVGVVFWYGMCAGAFLAAAVIRYGIKGILLVLAGMFPQYLVYIPAMVFMLLWCQNLYRSIYLIRGTGMEAAGGFFLPRRLLQLLGILLVFMVGCILESFLNPHLMAGLLKIF